MEYLNPTKILENLHKEEEQAYLEGDVKRMRTVGALLDSFVTDKLLEMVKGEQ